MAIEAHETQIDVLDISATQPIGHDAKRTFQSFPGSQYVLPSDAVEKDRLALQHQLLKRVFENRAILPPITFPLHSKILDSGTGSDSWLLRYNYRNGSEHSQRCSEYSHRGGWVQIGEVGPWTAGSVTATHKSLVEALFEFKGLHLDCLKFIAELLREAGFIAIYEEERSIPLGKWGGQDGIDGRDNFIGVFRGMKTPILNAGGLGFVQTEGEFDSLLDAVEQEWDETSGAEIKFSVIYATKPIPVPMASL
ncbi:hypothetical protein EW026_g5044 [Hermanssonia centrifuga]|uniref:Uncharacterized protein n=1 Tax=Hermanssonia centrifuga TaxID=98765 RepID=A0A4V3XA60_9APHY|nr:hypothetical protein EW026_g5044 [Hermanssonia centrifuga]